MPDKLADPSGSKDIYYVAELSNRPSLESWSAGGERALPDDGPRTGGASSGGAATRPKRLQGLPWDWLVLLVMLVSYASLMTYFSELRAESFFTSNWDLGINQQLLWSATHGRLLYEAGDFEYYGVRSFLQVHSAYLAFLIAPLYSAAPVPLTLFALQSTVVAASAVPLYLLARSVLRRPPLALLVVGAYLVSFGVVSSLMYDFHWEAFLPLEYLTFFLLVLRRRYIWALVPLAVGALTLEVFPFLAVGVALFFFFEQASTAKFRWRTIVRNRDARVLASFLVLSVVAYGMLRVAQYLLIPALVGQGGHAAGLGASSAGLFAVSWNAVTLSDSATYWLLLLAGFGFLPLLSPRHLILSLPWLYYSIVVAPLFSNYFGTAYGFVAVPALAVAFVYGLERFRGAPRPSRVDQLLWAGLPIGAIALAVAAGSQGGAARILGHHGGLELWVPVAFLVVLAVALDLRMLRPSLGRGTLGERPSRRRALSARHATAATICALFVAVLVMDGAMSPMNPQNFNATPIPGYQFEFGTNPMSLQMGWVTGFLPPEAQVLASDHLFPYVANDVNAWPYVWYQISPATPMPPYFPFTASNLPQFVLTDSSEFGLFPAYLRGDLLNPHIYGIVAYVYANASPGTVYLFSRGYTLPPEVRYLSPKLLQYYYAAESLSLGVDGSVRPDPASAFGSVIRTVPIGAQPGSVVDVWYGPYVTLLPSTYQVTFSLSGRMTNATNAAFPIAYLDGSYDSGAVGALLFTLPIFANQVGPDSWSTLSVTISVTLPLPNVEFRGMVALTSTGLPAASLTLNYIELIPLSS